MTKVNKIFLILCLVILVGTSIFALFVVLSPHKVNNILPQNNNEPSINSGLEVFSPKPNDVVSSPLKITGVVKGDGWTGFEGQVGRVTLQDSTGKELASAPLTATTEWTQLPTHFEANVTFNKGQATSGKLIFHNENASGDPKKEKTFIIPVTFK